MKRKLAPILLVCAAFIINACQQSDPINDTSTRQISPATLQKIKALGFDVTHMPPVRVDNGYRIEGDIYLTDANLNSMHQDAAGTSPEQYWGGNLVTGTPRNITIYIAPTFTSSYIVALNSAIAQYNALGISLTFTRVATSAGANIIITRLPVAQETQGVFASAGFPSGGNPYGSILLNGILISTFGVSVNGLSTVLVHEIGHCIGLRHTNTGDPQCPLTGPGVGGILVPGTPVVDPNSVMRPCHDGIFRPFSQHDKTMLNYLY